MTRKGVVVVGSATTKRGNTPIDVPAKAGVHIRGDQVVVRMGKDNEGTYSLKYCNFKTHAEIHERLIKSAISKLKNTRKTSTKKPSENNRSKSSKSTGTKLVSMKQVQEAMDTMTNDKLDDVIQYALKVRRTRK